MGLQMCIRPTPIRFYTHAYCYAYPIFFILFPNNHGILSTTTLAFERTLVARIHNNYKLIIIDR